jgi:hypothetical protein
MKTKIAISAALAVVLASPAFAAPPKHRVPAASAPMESYGQSNERYVAKQPDAVTLGNRVIGEDPDPNIRSQMEHDPTPSEY